MIDIHTHVLPGMDDGSGSLNESLQLLEESAQQGVKIMGATSHFYATDERPADFLRRRRVAATELGEHWREGMPHLLLGAEVHFFESISRIDELDYFRLGTSKLLLLEMPFKPWTDRMIREVLDIQDRRGLTVLLAHIERYLGFQDKAVWPMLRANGVCMQCNASFFLNWKTRRKAMGMLKRGEIHMLGSDCHNMTTRPPRLWEAKAAIQKALGMSFWREFELGTIDLLQSGRHS